MLWSTTALTLALGLLAGASLWSVVAWAQRPTLDLSSAVETASTRATAEGPRHGRGATARIPRVGAWVLSTLNLTVPARTKALLRLRGISEEEHYGARAVSALVLPVFIGFAGVILAPQLPIGVPAIALPATAVAGWFFPLLQLRRTAETTSEDASEALLVFIDLVILHRLANASITDALTRAASVSDVPIFIQIRTALARAQLEQEQPWRHLDLLADEIDMPQLRDITAIARLQTQGAALSPALQARVTELRQAHLTNAQQQAIAVTQQMKLWTALPVVAVLGILVGAPLLKLILGQN